MTPYQSYGLSVELWVSELFRSAGFSVHLPSYFFQPGADLFLDGFLPVHVKSARWCVRRSTPSVLGCRYQFNLTNLFHPMTYNPDASSLVVLVAQSLTVGFVPFFVPLSAFRGRCVVLSITSNPATYGGWLSPYRWSWPTVHNSLSLAASQYMLKLPLFSEV